jgi:arginyl-tRNA synthetase
MLRLWEAGDKEIVDLWKTMNGWVYAGFEKTYLDLGVSFDQMYYESNTYLLGKSIVLEGLEKGVLYRKEDSSVWADMTADGLDHKLLLRSDGTSVYMTQDVGTAVMRFNEFPISELIYVVGNEQNYHFQALSLIMAKLGYPFAQHLHHLSYGMVELPEGKMKSREGTVVDADDLIEEMVSTAHQMSQELGKLDGYSPEEASEVSRIVGLGALKYFILKVDPKKNMTFDPKESIDFNGNTGPFIQYTYARINSVLRKADEQGIKISPLGESAAEMLDKEKYLIQLIGEFAGVVAESASTYSPSLIANYIYELSKEYNQFYHDYSILKGETPGVINFRLILSMVIGRIIKNGMYLLGMEVPARM